MMTRTLLRTVGTLVLALTFLTGAAAPTVDSDDATTAIGPPSDLPDQVPDFVTTVVELIQEFLGGGSDASPGSAVSGAATGAGT